MRRTILPVVIRKTIGLAISAALLASCGGDENSGHADKVAPACELAPGSKALFTVPIVPLESVTHSLILGELSPDTFEEAVPNFEMGFKLGDDLREVPVTAPATMYVDSFESTYFFETFEDEFKQGQLDYSLSFYFCDSIRGGLAHITGLSAELVGLFAERLGTTGEDLLSREVSVGEATVSCDLAQMNADKNGDVKQACFESWLESGGSTRSNCETTGNMRKCAYFFLAEKGDFLVIDGGTAIGSTGGPEGSDFNPGLDLNMVDLRTTWPFVNPARFGGPDSFRGQSYLNAACPYEYFVDDTYREGLLDRVAFGLTPNESETNRCGTISVDVPHTGAGVWFVGDAAERFPEIGSVAALNLAEHQVPFHSSVLTLARHPAWPDTHGVISTPLPELAPASGTPVLWQYELETEGDTNVPFDEMAEETVYCVHAAAPYSGDEIYLFVMVEASSDPVDAELLVQVLEGTCDEQGGWSIDAQAALRFVR